MPGTSAQRMSRQARHTQLVGVGLQLLETVPFHELSVDDVAERVGISRSLLFHYFPTKQAYLTEVVRAAVGNVLELTHLPPSVAPADRPRSFVTALVRYIRRRRDNYVAVIRSAPSVDPALGLLIDEMHDMLAARLLVTLGHDDSDDLQLASARALVAGIEELALLAEERRLTTESIVEACLRAFTLISDDRVLKVLEQGHG